MKEHIMVRASIGTLAVLGLAKIKVDVLPTTAYILQYSENGCLAKCAFCPQSIISKCKEKVSRVPWPIVSLHTLIERLKGNNIIKRICVQSVIKPFFREELLKILKQLYDIGKDISLSLNIVEAHWLKEYSKYSNIIGVGLDIASQKLISTMGKPGTWDSYLKFIKRCIETYGTGNVYVHLIIGLGENDRELLYTMKLLHKLGCNIALFAFTPVRGTLLEDQKPPSLHRYRLFQLIRQLISEGYEVDNFVVFNNDKILGITRGPWVNDEKLLLSSVLTSGCPYCNRPFYNESPRGPLYNYPSMSIVLRDKERIIQELLQVII